MDEAHDDVVVSGVTPGDAGTHVVAGDDGSTEPLVAGHPARAPLPPEAALVYARLLERAPVDAKVLLGSFDDPADAARWLRHFEELGHVRCGADGRLHVAPPRTALAGWVTPRELEVDAARRTFDSVAALYAEHHAARTGFVELVEGREATRKVFYTLLASARDEVRGLDRGPYPEDVDGEPPEVEVAGLDRGVRYSVVYDTGVLQTRVGMLSVGSSIAAGESARVFPGVPVRMMLCDRDRGIVALPRRGGDEFDALVVYPSTLLDALSDLFEMFWRLGVPLQDLGTGDGLHGLDATHEPTRETQHLLALLTAGLADEVVARELGISERTVQRRIRRLQDLLGANTRFQLGVQAARRDWL
ncbi:LuxR C-terminal-related transcriptional regulator [Terrabacter sp. NPDC000476]|uniref:LuxR C-terminal-related transcriptional regulator n=1 Tax=Terrabacter sp. NPDC000476 TaxID=3154258 RepID=UPI0033330183